MKNKITSKLVMSILTLVAVLGATFSFKPVTAEAANAIYCTNVTIDNVIYSINVTLNDPAVTASTASNTGVIYSMRPATNSNSGVKIPKTAKCKINNKTYTVRIVGVGTSTIHHSSNPKNYKIQGKLDFSEATYCKSIENEAFKDADHIGFYFTSVDFDSVTQIRPNAFEGDTHITKITGLKLKDINNKAFYGCTNLTTAIFGTGAVEVTDYAFSGCYRLTTMKVQDANGSTSVKFPRIKHIGAYAFEHCGFTTVKLNSDYVGKNAFRDCKNLTKVTNSVKNCEYVGGMKNVFADTPYGWSL